MRKSRNSFVGSGNDETGIDPLFCAIRALLIGLPQVEAPVGFESRLWNSIDQIGSRRKGLNWDLWILARRWMSVGLGVATAVVIGLVFFESQQPEVPSTAFSERMEQGAPPSQGAFSMTSPATESTETDRSFTGSPERETNFDMAAGDRQGDSLLHEFNPPSGHFQSVGGNP